MTQKRTYLIFTVVVIIISMTSLIVRSNVSWIEKVGESLLGNFGAHLIFWFIHIGSRAQLSFVKEKEPWRKLNKFYFRFMAFSLIGCGILIFSFSIVSIFASTENHEFIRSTIGVSWFFGGMNLYRHLKMIEKKFQR